MQPNDSLKAAYIDGGFRLLKHENITDDELRLLAAFPWSYLELNCTHITDERLRLLRPQFIPRREVNTLFLENAKLLTNEAIKVVAWAFEAVHTLGLRECLNCTDDGLVSCANINGLADLTLDQWPGAGAGLAHLRKVPKLTRLSVIFQEEFDSSNLAHLRGLTIKDL